MTKEGKERGPKDFARIDLKEAEKRATTLPEDVCIPQLLIQNREDGGLEKILNQKAATPYNLTSRPEEAFLDHQRKITMLQRNTKDEEDETLKDAAAWDAMAETAFQVPPMQVTTGYSMLPTIT